MNRLQILLIFIFFLIKKCVNVNYVQDLFLVVVFVHIASGPAALLLLLLLGFSDHPWKKKNVTEATETPAEGTLGYVGLTSWSRCERNSRSLGVLVVSSSLWVLRQAERRRLVRQEANVFLCQG